MSITLSKKVNITLASLYSLLRTIIKLSQKLTIHFVNFFVTMHLTMLGANTTQCVVYHKVIALTGQRTKT